MFEAGVFPWNNRHSDSALAEEPRQKRARPSIGLALGGGAARGWAHIGVLKKLHEAGIVPDIIAGTSIGAVVGGCYSAGGLNELERFARDLSRRRVFGLMDFNFAGSGLITGNRLAGILDKGLGDTRIEDLKYKFVCIATELGTGHEIWLSKGHMVESMRASYAMPGLFKPVKVHGRWLIDGALVNPVPVSVCRAFGARLVIAVNLSTDIYGKGTVVRSHDPIAGMPAHDETKPETRDTPDGARTLLHRQLVGDSDPSSAPGISAVMVDAFNIVQDRIARSRLAGDPPDITIGPQVGQIGLFEFHRAAEAIEIGERTAERQIADIEAALVALA
jgi:NTE family protein